MRNSVTYVAAAITCALLVAFPGTAAAADGLGGVACIEHPESVECDVRTPAPRDPTSATGALSAGGSGNVGACRLRTLEPQPEPPAGAASGSWYMRDCRAGAGMAQSEAFWLNGANTAQKLALPAWSGLQPLSPLIQRPAGDRLLRPFTRLSFASSFRAADRLTAAGSAFSNRTQPVRVSRQLLCGVASTVAPWRLA